MWKMMSVGRLANVTLLDDWFGESWSRGIYGVGRSDALRGFRARS